MNKLSDDERNLLRYYAETERIIQGPMRGVAGQKITRRLAGLSPMMAVLIMRPLGNLRNGNELRVPPRALMRSGYIKERTTVDAPGRAGLVTAAGRKAHCGGEV
jgi:hypothetical protein